VVTMALGPDGLTSVLLRTPGRKVTFALGLPGEYNVRNAVTALAMIDTAGFTTAGNGMAGQAPVIEAGVDLDRAAAGLAAARVPGRMERVDLGVDAPAVFVDFAHTPQAVTAALAAVAGRRRIVVLGCGGDRDPDKREPMGAAAAAGAEVVLVTDDNPRSEEPATIREQVLTGARAARPGQTKATQILDGGDRRPAIRRALELAGPADVLLILGKGHELGQEIADTVLPFSDVEVVRDEWADLAAAGVTR
jgi:UDP-N-acetylmuramoyl-L-alanyl-D-glutamate--2,6-diaminopimelate ligase